MPRRLGCSENYQAAIHYQGGQRLYTRLDGVTALSWGRKLDDFSEAEVMVAKSQAGRACCQRLGRLEPWAHELTIYRDNRIVWQGPLIEPEEGRSHFTIPARDMIAWLDRRDLGLTFEDGYSGDAGTMLTQLMDDAFPAGDPYENPGLRQYAQITAPTAERYVATKKLWAHSMTVGALVRDILDTGIDMYTLGRALYLVPDGPRLARAPYRLHEDSFLDEVLVRRNGLDTATEAVVASEAVVGEVTGGQADLHPPPVWAQYPPEAPPGPDNPATPPWFGRITKFSRSMTQTADPTDPPDQNALLGIARAIRAYGWPTPTSIVVPDGARLSPEAPVNLNQLVPGRPFHVLLPSYCTPASEVFRLNEVEVTWERERQQVEQVAISLSSGRQPQDIEPVEVSSGEAQGTG